MTDSLREQMQARQLPTTVVPLAGPSADQPTLHLPLRALEPDVWEALVKEHPPTPEDLAAGHPWCAATFRPALIAASIVVPDGQARFSADDWIDYAATGRVTIGQLLELWDAAMALNDRTSGTAASVADLGKDSAATPGSLTR